MKRRLFLFFFGILFLTSALADGASAQTLKVALYPDVPRIEQFKAAIEAAWAGVEPGVSIEWQDSWDGGYEADPSADFDVYVFDALFLSYFNAKGWLYNIPKADVANLDDFLDYAAKGVESGDKVMGIPQLGCTTVLFHHADDAAMNKAVTLDDVGKALGACTYYTRTPEGGTGLMADFSNDSANAGFYVQSLECDQAKFPVKLPYSQSEVDPVIIGYIRQVLSMSSFQDALYEAPQSYQRAYWFGQGHGRAYIDYTESLSVIPADRYDNIAFKVMPWADNREGVKSPLFYSDVIGVHGSTAARGTRDLAVKLANLMASRDVIVQCLGPYDGKGPQYLMPARTSAFEILGAKFPMYEKIYEMVKSITPIMFDIGSDARNWFNTMQAALSNDYKADPACYCDHDAGPIFNQRQAERACLRACSQFNGWNGQWTTRGGTSYCGCNQACP